MNKKVLLIVVVLLIGVLSVYFYNRIELQNNVNRYINEVEEHEVVLQNFYNLLESSQNKTEVPKQDVICIMAMLHQNLEEVNSRYANSALSENDIGKKLLELHADKSKRIEKYLVPKSSKEYYKEKCISPN